MYITQVLYSWETKTSTDFQRWPVDHIMFGIMGSSLPEEKQPKRIYNIKLSN